MDLQAGYGVDNSGFRHPMAGVDRTYLDRFAEGGATAAYFVCEGTPEETERLKAELSAMAGQIASRMSPNPA